MHPKAGAELPWGDEAKGTFTARLRRTLPSGWSEIETAPSPDGCHAGTQHVALRLFVRTSTLVPVLRQRVELKFGASRLVLYPGAEVRKGDGLSEVVAGRRVFRVVLPRGVVGTSYVPRPQKKAAVRNEETTEADPITPSKDWATKGKLVTLTEACAEAHFPGSSTSEGSHLASIFDKKPVLGSFRESALLFWPDGSPAGACDELELVPADLHGPKNQLCFDHDLGGTTARLCLHHGREPTIEETMQEAIEREKHGEGRAP